MKNEKLYPKEKQKGVVSYHDLAEDTGNGDAIDIDVDDDVKEVEIWCDLVMPDSKKSFPNVESLVIKSNVFEIRNSEQSVSKCEMGPVGKRQFQDRKLSCSE